MRIAVVHFLAEVAPQVSAGKIKYREDIRRGLENVPTCFGEMLSGGNFGKMLAHVAPDPTSQLAGVPEKPNRQQHADRDHAQIQELLVDGLQHHRAGPAAD